VTPAIASNWDGGAFDVAVIGAGPAGAAIARWLALAGRRVALVERSSFDVPRVGESLAPAVQPLLKELGLWGPFRALEPLPSHGTRSHWGEDTPRVHAHVMNPWGSGWHVDRLAFDRMLADGACQVGAIPFVGVALASCAETPDGWRLTLTERASEHTADRGLSLSARILVDATGRAARLASRVGGWRLPLDHLVAAAVRFDGADVDRETYVLVETTADGWWYSAPVPGGGMMAMIMTDGDLCRRLRLGTADAWSARLPTAPVTRARLAGARPAGGPRVFSAVSHRLRRPATARPRPWLAVGDAALAVDPVSGSGVVRALRTARAGADAVLAVLDTGSTDAIARYETERDLECSRYLEERAMYYALERRFSGQPFWVRRDAAVSAYRKAG
jgi:flavin-dependent dehydrogenase